MRLFVYYFLNVILSILLGMALILNQKIIFTIILISIFLLILNKNLNSKIRIILVLLSFISFFNIVKYYSYEEEFIYSNKFRVVNKTANDIIVKSKNIFPKKYIIKDFENLDNVKMGIILVLDGKIEKSNYYDIGVVMEIKDYVINKFESDFVFKLINVKNSIKEFFIKSFGDKKGNILSSLTFGDTSNLNKQYKNDLKSLGIIHILSVSGFHINLIFIIVSKFLNWFSSLIISFLYLLFTGVKVSGIRAFTMMFLRESSSKVCRTYDAINALCFSGVLILLFRSYEIFNLGFIYSFSATLGILMFNKKINDYLYKLPKLFADSLSLILSAQIFILPISVLIERNFGLGFLLSNILLVPFYSVLMFLGIIFAFFRMIPFISKIIYYLIEIIFAVIDGGIIFIKSIVPKTFYLDNYIIIFILCLYVIYFISIQIGYNKIKNIPILLFGLFFIFTNTFDLKIESGRYFDRNYVILRNKFKSYMYVDKKIDNTEILEEKLGVDKIFKSDGEDLMFYKNRFCINFNDDKIFIKFNFKNIIIKNSKYKGKYYSDIYPDKFYIIF